MLAPGAALGWTRASPVTVGAPSSGRLHNKGVYVRVGLQKMSQSRSLHKEIRLQVEQREVELPSIEGLIFINIPRCQWVGLSGALPQLQPQLQAGPGSGGALGPVQPALTCAPLPLGTVGAQGLTCGVPTVTRGLKSHEWTTGCWRWWG